MADLTYESNTTGMCYPGRLADGTQPRSCDLTGEHPINAPVWAAHLGVPWAGRICMPASIGPGPTVFLDVVPAENKPIRNAAGPGKHVATTVSVRLHFLEAQMPWLSDALRAPRGTVTLHAPGTQWTANFLDSVDWVLDAVERYPLAVGRADVLGSLTDVLLAGINTLDAAPVSNDRKARVARRAAVMRAQAYIDTHLVEPIKLSDLCRHAHAQSRSLEYGFREVLGVSPIAYIRAMRLHNARRLLRSTTVRTRSTSEIAMDCGFWHLSQFAVDYKKFFAESPSATRKRTRAMLPKRAVRDPPLSR
jgi:AraC-like DNA-binding protein